MNFDIKKVGLITYNFPHLKTDQVIQKLIRKDYQYKIYALPFIQRKKREVLFEHRPNQSDTVTTKQIAEKHNIEYKVCQTDLEIDFDCDIYIILGSGILSENCVKGKKIINSHPGIIPISRGLDSFKWAILDKKPIGVTLHFIDENVDSGSIIYISETPVYEGDSLQSLARRHYENEIDCLSNFDMPFKNINSKFNGLKECDAKKRMPIEKEREMINAFPAYIKMYGNNHKLQYS